MGAVCRLSIADPATLLLPSLLRLLPLRLLPLRLLPLRLLRLLPLLVLPMCRW
jgi:hypothetical protein